MAIRISFTEQISETMFFFHIAQTYPLGGVDVFFWGLMFFELLKWPTIGHNYLEYARYLANRAR